MKNRVGIALAAAGTLLCALGIWQGQHEAVLAKAIRICMECVGIG